MIRRRTVDDKGAAETVDVLDGELRMVPMSAFGDLSQNFAARDKPEA
jgi:hypothetical protein